MPTAVREMLLRPLALRGASSVIKTRNSPRATSAGSQETGRGRVLPGQPIIVLATVDLS